eukprot:gnl/TRDRNA2_/TRDRNA2_176047_c0_seq1.p1 gnl/TRDRNA2_/TRDRNA2_176047_c0~~gnl/TRDRNA2_/TRDRNA2_176047_c0_seq1.p1  ORF type:complete len:397 (+),score=57.08 gnl/TRDRNA2_/TRDRNA2_176047_c0_seq1:83-1273(+)
MGSSHSCSLELTQLAARIEKGPVSQDSSPPPIGKKNSSQLPPPLPEWGRHTEDRFDLDDPQALRHLFEEGYVVIAGALNEEDLEKSRAELWDVLEASAPGVCRGVVDTWGGDEVDWPADPATGILRPLGVSHSPLLWRVRAAPGVRGTFERIWGTRRLLSSFDGAGVFRPLLREEWRTRGGWFHVDQGAQKRGLQSVQGFVSLYDASEATGSLVVVPRSHLHHDKVVSRNHGPRGMDFVRLRNDDPLLRDEAGPKPRLICCRAGDLVIWDSRTVHCNTPALVEDRELQCRAELLRAVAYVCMTPASWAPWAVIRKRRAAAAHGVGTTHWPHEFHPTTAPDLPAPDWAPRASMTPERQKLIDGGFWGFLLLSNSPLLVGVTSLAVLVAALCAAAATS